MPSTMLRAIESSCMSDQRVLPNERLDHRQCFADRRLDGGTQSDPSVALHCVGLTANYQHAARSSAHCPYETEHVRGMKSVRLHRRGGNLLCLHIGLDRVERARSSTERYRIDEKREIGAV